LPFTDNNFDIVILQAGYNNIWNLEVWKNPYQYQKSSIYTKPAKPEKYFIRLTSSIPYYPKGTLSIKGEGEGCRYLFYRNSKIQVLIN